MLLFFYVILENADSVQIVMQSSNFSKCSIDLMNDKIQTNKDNL